MKTLKLSSGHKIPILGFGTYELTGSIAQSSVETAIEVGYRHIDTAEVYGNQKDIGKAIKSSGLNRSDLFITSKVWRTNLHKEDVRIACEKTLKNLQIDYLDLYLIHWPNSSIPVGETLTALEKLQTQGLIKSIGVSNFTKRHIDEALETQIDFSINQFELHPSLYQKNLVEHCKENNVVVTAYSPVAQGEDLDSAEVVEIAEKHNVSEAQVILAWIMQKNIAAIPRSGNPEHIRDNFGALNLELDSDDIKALDQLNTGNRIVNPPFGEF